MSGAATDTTARQSIRAACTDRAPVSEIRWRSADNSTAVWRVGRGDWRIQTADPARARHLGKLTNVESVGRCVVGGFEEWFATNSRKLRSKVVRGILHGGAS